MNVIFDQSKGSSHLPEKHKVEISQIEVEDSLLYKNSVLIDKKVEILLHYKDASHNRILTISLNMETVGELINDLKSTLEFLENT